jgi:acetyl esterase/lipase
MLNFLRLVCIAALSLLGVGCSVLSAVNAVSSESGVEVHPGQHYGPLARQGVDVYTPKQAAEQPRAVVIFFYGGGWQTGSKGEYRFAGEALAAQGFVAVVPDYRVYPEVRFPLFLEDGAGAVRWVHDHIQEFGGDPQRVFLMGHSAGAHIAAMLALDPRYLAAQGLAPKDLRGFIGVAGP